jgi:hypothetical protein
MTYYVTIKNLTDRPIGNFTYRTSNLSETGVPLDGWNRLSQLMDDQRILRRIEAKQSRTFELTELVHREVERVSFLVTNFEYLD